MQPVHKNLCTTKLVFLMNWQSNNKIEAEKNSEKKARREELNTKSRMLLLIFKCIPLRAGHNYLIISILQVKLPIELDVFVL